MWCCYLTAVRALNSPPITAFTTNYSAKYSLTELLVWLYTLVIWYGNKVYCYTLYHNLNQQIMWCNYNCVYHNFKCMAFVLIIQFCTSLDATISCYMLQHWMQIKVMLLTFSLSFFFPLHLFVLSKSVSGTQSILHRLDYLPATAAKCVQAFNTVTQLAGFHAF